MGDNYYFSYSLKKYMCDVEKLSNYQMMIKFIFLSVKVIINIELF